MRAIGGRTEQIREPAGRLRDDAVEARAGVYFDARDALLVAVPPERVRVLVLVVRGGTRDAHARPAELLDGDERLAEVRVAREEERAQVQREALRVQDVRGRLSEVWLA